MSAFRFELGAEVTIECSGEHGQIIGRAEYLIDEARYLIRYKCADGRAVENWWPEVALISI